MLSKSSGRGLEGLFQPGMFTGSGTVDRACGAGGDPGFGLDDDGSLGFPAAGGAGGGGGGVVMFDGPNGSPGVCAPAPYVHSIGSIRAFAGARFTYMPSGLGFTTTSSNRFPILSHINPSALQLVQEPLTGLQRDTRVRNEIHDLHFFLVLTLMNL